MNMLKAIRRLLARKPKQVQAPERQALQPRQRVLVLWPETVTPRVHQATLGTLDHIVGPMHQDVTYGKLQTGYVDVKKSQPDVLVVVVPDGYAHLYCHLMTCIETDPAIKPLDLVLVADLPLHFISPRTNPYGRDLKNAVVGDIAARREESEDVFH